MSKARKLPTPQLLLRWGIEHGGAVVTTSTQVGLALTNYVTTHLIVLQFTSSSRLIDL